MPTYAFKCDCGAVTEKFVTSIGRKPSIVACCKCGRPAASRDYATEVGCGCNAAAVDIVSVNAGVTLHQVKDANRRFADLGVRFCEKTGNMISPDRNTHLKALRRRGLHNNDEIRGGV